MQDEQVVPVTNVPSRSPGRQTECPAADPGVALAGASSNLGKDANYRLTHAGSERGVL